MEGATGVFTSSLEEYNTGLGDEYGELESDINECSLSVDEARQIAEEFLSKIGGSDVIYRVNRICAGCIGTMVRLTRICRRL